MHPIGPNIGCRTESNSTLVSSNWKLINTGRVKKKTGIKIFDTKFSKFLFALDLRLKTLRNVKN